MYRQNNPRWANKTFYKDWTFGACGCYITALGNMVDLDPVATAKLLTDGKGLVGGLVQSKTAASILGLEYNGISTTPPGYDCIGETDYYSPKNPQHFFNVLANGNQFDPLGIRKYPIKTYRLFRRTMTEAERLKLLAELNTCKSNLTLNEKAVADIMKESIARGETIKARDISIKEITAKLAKLDVDFDTYREDSADKITELMNSCLDKDKQIEALKAKDISKLSFWQKISILFS